MQIHTSEAKVNVTRCWMALADVALRTSELSIKAKDKPRSSLISSYIPFTMQLPEVYYTSAIKWNTFLNPLSPSFAHQLIYFYKFFKLCHKSHFLSPCCKILSHLSRANDANFQENIDTISKENHACVFLEVLFYNVVNKLLFQILIWPNSKKWSGQKSKLLKLQKYDRWT